MAGIHLRVLFLIWFTATINNALGQHWEMIGSPIPGVGESRMEVTKSGIPFIAFRENGAVSVKKFNGASWEYIGLPDFFPLPTWYLDLALDSAGTPYIFFSDKNISQRPTVMKFDGTDWVYVGSRGFISDSVAYCKITFGADNLPYICFRQGGDTLGISVMKFNGLTWEYVGIPNFSLGTVTWCDLAMSVDGNPIVAFTDYLAQYKITVMKYDGSSWLTVGNRGFSQGPTNFCSVKVDHEGVPYVTFRDAFYANRVTVMKFENGNWTYVGSPGFGGYSWETSIDINLSNIPYVSYLNMDNVLIEVMKFDGSDWILLGDSAPIGYGVFPDISIDSSGIVYVSSDGNVDLRVMKFDSNATSVGEGISMNLIKAYPNPVHDVLQIEMIEEKKYEFSLYDLMGRNIWKYKSDERNFNNKLKFNLEMLTPGAYLLNVIFGKSSLYLKILKQ